MSNYQKLAIARETILNKMQDVMQGSGDPLCCDLRKMNYLRRMEANILRGMRSCEFDANSEEAEELSNRVVWEKIQRINIPQDAINEIIASQYTTNLGQECQAQLAFNVWFGAMTKGAKLDPLPDSIIVNLSEDAQKKYWRLIDEKEKKRF